jgi:signal transduction histidine kinase
MIRTAAKTLGGALSRLTAYAGHRRLLLEAAWLAYMVFTLVAFPCCNVSAMLPSILLCGFASWLYHYKMGLLTLVLSIPYNALLMMYHLDSLSGWHSALEPGGISAQLIAVLCVTAAKNNRKKTIGLTNALEKCIKKRTAELQEVASYVKNQSEAEQSRASKNLCDIVDYQLIGLLYHSETLRNFLSYIGAPHVSDAVKLVEIAEKNIEQVRNLTETFSPQIIMKVGIQHALHEMCTHLTQTTGIQFTEYVTPRHREIPAEIALPIYRIAYETVTNALRHGKATHISIQLELDDENLSLTITNDGLPLPDSIIEGVGLRLIHQRAENIHADIRYTHDKSGKTIFHCVLNRHAGRQIKSF